MIIIEKEEIKDIPLLHIVDDANKDALVPIVIYYHGFYGKKQDSLTIAYNLAKQGIRVILPDSFMHGERNNHATKEEIDLAFWEIVLQNVQDLQEIKTYLQSTKRWRQDENKIGLAGTSMGGITTAAALTQYEWIDSAAIVMGSPNLREFANYLIENYNAIAPEKIPDYIIKETLEKIEVFDLAKYPEYIYDRPLLFWHGEEDKVVPTVLSEQFYLDNRGKVTDSSQLKYVKEAGRSHHVSRLAVEEVTKWFTTHLL